MIKLLSRAESSGTLSGSYLLARSGTLHPVYLHSPSTKWVGQGKEFLAPIDAEFLLDTGAITESEAESIVVFNGIDFLRDNNSDEMSMLMMTKFKQNAELGRFAPKMRDVSVVSMMGKSLEVLENDLTQLPDFDQLNHKWYPYLQNQFVKVAVYRDTLDFRISSNDGFDWNKVIVDKVLLNQNYNLQGFKFTISRESIKGYKTYFEKATLDDILRNDGIILSPAGWKVRKVVAEEVMYVGGDDDE